MFALCLTKSEFSYNRIVNTFESCQFEPFESDIDRINENIYLRQFDFAILDTKFVWYNDCRSALESKGIIIFDFNGAFDELEEQVGSFLRNVAEHDTTAATSEDAPTAAVDNTPIRYVVKERTVEVPVIHKVPEFKALYANMEKKTVGVLGVSPCCGASMIVGGLANLMVQFECGVHVVEIPHPGKPPYFYDAIGAGVKADPTFDSIPHLVKNNKSVAKNDGVFIDDIYWVIPRPDLPKIQEWSYEDSLKLLYTTKKTSLCFVDLGSGVLDNSIKSILDSFDELFVVIDPSRVTLEQYRDHIDYLRDLSESKSSNVNVRFIVNKWVGAIKKEDFVFSTGIRKYLAFPMLDPDVLYRTLDNAQLITKEQHIADVFQDTFGSFIKDILPKSKLKEMGSGSDKKKWSLFNFRRGK